MYYPIDTIKNNRLIQRELSDGTIIYYNQDERPILAIKNSKSIQKLETVTEIINPFTGQYISITKTIFHIYENEIRKDYEPEITTDFFKYTGIKDKFFATEKINSFNNKKVLKESKIEIISNIYRRLVLLESKKENPFKFHKPSKVIYYKLVKGTKINESSASEFWIMDRVYINIFKNKNNDDICKIVYNYKNQNESIPASVYRLNKLGKLLFNPIRFLMYLISFSIFDTTFSIYIPNIFLKKTFWATNENDLKIISPKDENIHINGRNDTIFDSKNYSELLGIYLGDEFSRSLIPNEYFKNYKFEILKYYNKK